MYISKQVKLFPPAEPIWIGILSSSSSQVTTALPANWRPRPLGVGPASQRARLQGSEWPALRDMSLDAQLPALLRGGEQQAVLGAPLSDIVFFRYTRYLTIFHLMQYYRDIFTIFFKCKLGQNAPKFHSWSAYVEIFATKWPTCRIFIREHHTLGFFSTKIPFIKGFLF